MKATTIILLSITLLFGCTSQSKVMDSMLGYSKRDVMYKLGPPNTSQKDGSGGEILIYSQIKYFPAPPGSYNMAGQNIQYLKYLYFDSSGRMNYWRTERRQVAPGQMELIVR